MARAGWILPLALLAAGCAKQAPPPGGPVDDTPPTVVTQRPAADATGVPLNAPIVIEFSEAMDRSATDGAVFLSPADPFEVDWSGRRLRLRVPGGLAQGRTYVVTVGTDAQDLRRNKLEDAFHFAFATGERLDSGTLEGRILSPGDAPERGAYVWAYDLARAGGRIVVDPPAYVTQTGTDGSYRFERLAPARYRVLAFVDEDRDQRPDRGELLALPAADVDVAAEGVTQAGDQRLADRAATAPRLTRASAVDAGRVLLVFDRSVAAPPEVEVEGLEIRAVYADDQDLKRLHLLTGPQQDGKRYRLRVRLDGELLRGPEDPLRGTSRPDRSAPKVVAAKPAGAVAPGVELRLTFSEAMDTTRVPGVEAWARATGEAPPGNGDRRAAQGPPRPPAIPQDASGDSLTGAAAALATVEETAEAADAAEPPAAPAGRWHWDSWTRLVFTPEAAFGPGPQQLAVWLRESLRDRAGNAVVDSAAGFAFEVLEPEQLSTVTGQVTWAERPVRVTLRDAAGALRSTPVDSAGAFRFAGLTPGTYTVVAWVDRDGDGAWSAGQVEPYAPAEPYAVRSGVQVAQAVTLSLVLPAPLTKGEESNP